MKSRSTSNNVIIRDLSTFSHKLNPKLHQLSRANSNILSFVVWTL